MASVIHNHSSLLYHMTFIQLTQGLLFSANNLSTHIHHFVQNILTPNTQASKPKQEWKHLKINSMQLWWKVCKTSAWTLRDLSFWRQNTLDWHFLWIKIMFMLKFSLLSKTVPEYLYSVTLSTFTTSVDRSGTVGFFLKSINISFVYIKSRSSQRSLQHFLNFYSMKC